VPIDAGGHGDGWTLASIDKVDLTYVVPAD